MSEKEFKDLQNFGKTIEKNSENTEKIIVKEKKNHLKQIKKILIHLGRKTYNGAKILLKYSISTGGWIYIKIKSITLPRKKKQYKCYKIVEITKQKRNKIVIIRKRVQFEYNKFTQNLNRAKLGKIYYLTLKDGNNQETKQEAYTILKDSVWDFPIEREKRK